MLARNIGGSVSLPALCREALKVAVVGLCSFGPWRRGGTVREGLDFRTR
jgi:hypothetical protein